MTVKQLCVELGIYRQTFYKYQRRWVAEGPAGLVERYDIHTGFLGLIPVELEDEIVRLRKTLPLDKGAQAIAYGSARGGWVVPIEYDDPPSAGAPRHGHRAAAETARRASWRRSSWPRPNDRVADGPRPVGRCDQGSEVWVMDILDEPFPARRSRSTSVAARPVRLLGQRSATRRSATGSRPMS